ncbi:GAF domain-containing protein [Streptomyces shenzhenensis]|uniref:GAF domain-containing protein n=1 Tax=Streptomyces shenzhenensis TaxID=943815 RepID=UPI001F36EC84|nr:GAF domain-containing protein [Streptomyces shenzhenensis]
MSAAEREPHRPDPSARCPTAPDPGRLHFPDPARLELDQAVESLLAAAHEVRRAQDRIRALLRAVMLVTDESDPGGVLRQLVTSARDLTEAVWAAVVPSDEPARPDGMIRAGLQGVDAGRLARIAHGLHALQGLFGDRDTVRVDDAVRHLPGAPPASALLGFVIRTRRGDVAHLYLADKHRPGHPPGPFTSEDEELVQVLASAAGNAMDHAALLERTRLREAWRHADTQLTTAVPGDADCDRALQVIAEQALRIAEADAALVSLPDHAPGRLVVRAAAGLASSDLLGRTRFVDAASLTGRAYATGRPQISDDGSGPLVLGPELPIATRLGPAMAVPLTDRDTPVGTLSVARARTRGRFGDTEVELLASFAVQAALTRCLAAHRADDERLRHLRDRDRIGADLHDRAVHDLYAVGLDLHSIAGRLDADRQRAVLDVVDRIDEVIKDVTNTVFGLRTGPER